jgi:ABC-2 type transport system permease protein
LRALEIALKDVKVVARDLKALAIIIAMPLVLVFILGAALGPMFAKQETVSAFDVAVVNLDNGQVSQHLMDVLESERVSSLIRVQSAKSEEDAAELIRKGTVASAIVIPEGFSDNAAIAGSQIRVLGDPGEPIRSQIGKGIVSSFASQYSVVAAGTSAVMEQLMMATGPLPQTQELAARVVEDIAAETSAAAGFFAESEQESGWITSLQYYTASMTAMFVLYGAMLGVKSILDEKQTGTMARLFSTRATPREIIVGKTLATYAVCLLQVVILILFTRFVFRVDWGPSLLNVFAVSAVMALAATGFAILIAALSKTEKMADALQNIGVQVMAFVGGCQYPIYQFPKAMHFLSKFTLTRWSLDSFLTLMDGGVWRADDAAGHPCAMGWAFSQSASGGSGWSRGRQGEQAICGCGVALLKAWKEKTS